MSSPGEKPEQRESMEEGSERASGGRTRTEKPMRSLDTERDLKGVTEEKYRLLVENANQGIVVIQDGMLKYLNPKAAEVTGWPKQELISKPFADIVHPDDRSMVAESHQRRMGGEGKLQAYAFRIVDKQGRVRWLENHGVDIEWEGKPAGLDSLTDITKRKMAETQIQRAHHIQSVLNRLLQLSLEALSLEEMLRRIIDHIVSIPWLAVESKGAIFLVEEEPEVLVLKAQRGLPQSLQAVCARVPFGRCLCGRAAQSGGIKFADRIDERHQNRYEGISAHGHYCVPIVASDKRVLGVINLYLQEGHRRDERETQFLCAVANVLVGIIERQRAVEALRESEEKYRTLFENSIEGIGISKGNRVVAANRALLDTFGYDTLEEFRQVPITGHVAPEFRSLIRERMRKRERGEPLPARYEYTIVRKEGKSRDLEISTTEVLIDKERHVLSTFRDITERKRADEKIRQTSELLQIEREALERKNVALGEILNRIDGEKNTLKRQIVANVEQTIIPTIVRLKKSSQSFQHRIFDMLEKDLKEIVSPFLGILKTNYSRLSPRELEVCRLIKNGMSSKEIAEALSLSLWTVYKHRDQIRKKLGLTNSGANLPAYLQSL